MYSGYLNITHTKKALHYVAVMSENLFESDPVIIWFNGGSGCSSLIGYTLEHGPYIVNDGSPNFTENPYAWNKNATVFYIESPAGVGYSLCGDEKECMYNDTNQAEDNLAAVLTILREKFPALKNNELWISG